MIKQPTKRQRQVMARCHDNPKAYPPRKAMKALGIPYEYNRFARLMWRCIVADKEHGA